MSRGRVVVVAAVLLAACGEPQERPPAWDPELASTDDGGEATTGSMLEADSSTGTAEPDPCMPGRTEACACPEGTGERACLPDGSGFGECECEGAPDPGTTTGEPDEDVVCYPGMAYDWSTCLPLHYFDPLPEGYEYTPPYMGNPNYRPPIALIDLEEVDPATWLAPNFQLDEIAQAYKGRYAVVQPHAIESLQALRDEVGAISVNSGYRSPAYNASLDGSATYSRHMYGDGFDLDPLDVGLSELEVACGNEGGMLVEYTTHVHCDFRFDPVDEEFFGPEMAVVGPTPTWSAELVVDEHGTFTAPAQGFDEGEPRRRWTAYDRRGRVIQTAIGPTFTPAAGTATVAVRVGAQVERTAPVELAAR